MIFLTFDTEEFDSPLPYSQAMTFEQQMEISQKGTKSILDLLQRKKIKATFFCTAIFAIHAPDIVRRIVDEGHEVASHGYYHNRFEEVHLKSSRIALEELTGRKIEGFRMPFMGKVAIDKVAAAGYIYDSSLNPTYIPGSYNNLSKPRRCFYKNGLFQIPASVSFPFRIPLFWLSLHNFPLWIYSRMCLNAVKKDGYLNLYLHPWEFEELDSPTIDLAWYIKRNSGQKLLNRLERLIDSFQERGFKFGLLKDSVAKFGQK
jgi:peptidoglycan/xylan/chitin deacetylase (PgdA/CDA1 family)